VCTHATLWVKPPAPTTTRRRPAASASALGVAGVASASATGGDQATPVTSLPLAEQSFNSSLDPTPGRRRPDHEPADAMLMHTSLPAKSFARKGQRRSWPGPGAARLSVQGSEETKGVFTSHANPKYFLFALSHQIFRYMHGVLNVGKKITNYTVCL
jgi:hypothetical protein